MPVACVRGRWVRGLAAGILGLLVGLTGAQAATEWRADGQANLLDDGGFEKGAASVMGCERVLGRLPPAWRDNSCWHPAAVVRYDLDSFVAHQGRSVRVDLAKGVFQLSQPVRLQTDWQLKAGVWLRSAAPMMVKLALRQSGPPYLEYGARYVRTSDRWTWVAVSAFSHGLTEPDSRQALFMVSSATPGQLWIDDAVLTAQPSSLALPGSPIPPQFFGTHVHHLPNMRGVFGDSHAGSIRIWDAEGAQWASVQSKRPSKGKARYNWDSLDERVSVIGKHKADALMVVGGYAPIWASTDVDDEDDEWRSKDCYRCDEHPKRLEDWQKWVGDVSRRLAGGPVRYWEIWNEPYFMATHDWCPGEEGCKSGLGSGYRGTPEQLLQLQVEARKIIKKADPQALIVSSGISHHHRDYLDYFLRIGGGESADVIGYHMYLEGPPELAMSHILSLRGILRDHGQADKPLWCTEGGISEIALDLDPAVRAARAGGGRAPTVAELAPAYMSRFLIVSWAAGFARLYQYSWDTQHNWPGAPSRVGRHSNLVQDINEVGLAYRQTADWLGGKRMIALERGADQGAWKATLQAKDGARSQVWWHPGRSPAAPVLLKRPAEVQRVCDLAGRCKALDAETTIAVDFRPVYLE